MALHTTCAPAGKMGVDGALRWRRSRRDGQRRGWNVVDGRLSVVLLVGLGMLGGMGDYRMADGAGHGGVGIDRKRHGRAS